MIQQFLPMIKSPWFLQAELWGHWNYLPDIGILSGGPGVGLGLLTSEISLPNFYPPYVGE